MRLDLHGIRSVAPSMGIDTDNRSPTGKLLLHIMGSNDPNRHTGATLEERSAIVTCWTSL
jgi:hypothetical protein